MTITVCFCAYILCPKQSLFNFVNVWNSNAWIDTAIKGFKFTLSVALLTLHEIYIVVCPNSADELGLVLVKTHSKHWLTLNNTAC